MHTLSRMGVDLWFPDNVEVSDILTLNGGLLDDRPFIGHVQWEMAFGYGIQST